jgi:hypothetical protein
MATRLIGEHWEGDVRVRWYGDDATHEITIERWQDPQILVDKVAAVNIDGAPTIDGLGKPIGEIPVVKAQEWAARRGIPWEKLLYSNEYDGELRAFIRENQKLAYRSTKTVHTVQ